MAGATLSGAVPPDQANLKFERVEGDADMYKAAVPHRVWWVMAGGRNLVNYGDVENLRAFKFPKPGEKGKPSSDCVPEGFAWQGGTLFVRLEGGTDPNAVAVEIHHPGGHSSADPEFSNQSYYAPDTGFHVPGTGHMFSRSLANIVVMADHVVIEGLRLHLGVGASVLVHGNEVTIRDCYMSGAHIGVLQPDSDPAPPRGSPPVRGSNRTDRGLTVEHCEFSGYPVYEWDHRNQKYWDTLYHTNIAAMFMNYGGPRSIVRHNWAYECFDGLEPRGNGTTSTAEASEFAYNILQNCADDSIEFDSATAMNLRVHHNIILNGLCLLALSPVMGGGLTIDHNILYVSPEKGLTWCGLFKGGSPWGSGLPTQGVRIVHNTMVNTKGENIGLWWVGGHRYEDMVIENNIFYVRAVAELQCAGLVFGRHNLYCGRRADPRHIPEMMHFEGSPFVSMDPMDFRLRKDSPAVDAGAAGEGYHHEARGKAPDLGAIEQGNAWRFPPPGPRWAKGNEIANRPSLPILVEGLSWRPRMPRLDHPVRADGSLEEATSPASPATAEFDLQPRDLTPVTRLEAPAHPLVELVRDGKARAVVFVADTEPCETLERMLKEVRP